MCKHNVQCSLFFAMLVSMVMLCIYYDQEKTPTFFKNIILDNHNIISSSIKNGNNTGYQFNRGPRVYDFNMTMDEMPGLVAGWKTVINNITNVLALVSIIS